VKWYKVTFLYKGKKQEIIIKSLNKVEAIMDSKKDPKNKGMLIKIEEIPMPLEEKIKILKNIFKKRILRKKLNYPIYISSLRQIVVLIKAGISLKDALEDIANNTKDLLIKEVFSKTAEAIDSGKSLSDVFAEYIEFLGSISLALVKLGEQTGDLVMAFESLIQIYENIYENRKKMIKALRYPIITFIALIIAFTFLILVVVPKFKAIFEQLHANLPLLTRILLLIEDMLSQYGFLVLGVIIFTILTITFFYKSSYEFKLQTDKILLKTFLINKILEYSTLHRFLMTIATLIKSGLSLVEALKISEGIIENEVIKNKINRILKGINKGRSFAEMVAEVDLVNFIALRMIKAGEESGELDLMLQNAAKYYEDRFQDIIENMHSSIEPIMLTIIGSLVLLIALGIFLPMWDLANAVKNI
jgi:general secretion pathway protein F/MSHA biogenesis protein MshG